MMHFVSMLCVMLSVGFFTLYERKCLSYFQLRKGPNKVGYAGLAQPLADALKLFLKEKESPLKSVAFFYSFAPVFSLILAMASWVLYESFLGFSSFFWGVFFYAIVCSLGVFPVFLAGWSSQSKYGMLGGIRCLAQTVSYEISFTLGLSFFMFFYFSSDFYGVKWLYWPLFLCFWPCVVWFTTCVAEVHRAPFDFAEGESELVSGYHVEYGGAGFAFLFISEYGFILLSCCVFSVLFFGGCELKWQGWLIFWIKVFFFSFLFILLRGSFPRLRYDLLMMLVWKRFIPWMTVFLMCLVCLMY